jgi:succinate dehydrogenase/fumarate reductase flavoprotein subunit
MRPLSLPTYTSDVLVIGGGAAGSIAAIAASDAGADVLLTNKGFLGRTGTTASTQGGIAGVLEPPDDPSRFADDMLRCGHHLNDRESVRLFVTEVHKGEVLNLEKFGVSFDRDADNNLRSLKVGGHSFPRMILATWLSATTILRYGLVPQILRRGIRVADQVLMTKLLVSDGRIAGALGLDLKTGRLTLFRSRTVVLATGNAGQLFGESAGASATGDGYALAYQAGARLRDMEFVSCTIGLAHPPGLRGKVLGEPSTVPGSKPRLYNAAKAPFLEQHFPDASSYTKDMYMLGIARELRDGRGSPHGGVWYDFSNLDPLGPSYPFVRQVIDFLGPSATPGGAVECTLAPYFFPGGVEYDEHHESRVQGLFVAGEVAGGLHGAERTASTAMAEAIVFGKRAGRFAATRAADRRKTEINWEDVGREEARLLAMLDQPGPETPRQVRRKIQATMWQKVGFIRSRSRLLEAQADLEEVARVGLGRARIRSKNPKANLDWVELIEDHFLVAVAEMLVAAALRREESRGSHYREDYPGKSAEWVKKIVMDQDGGRMRCAALDV